MSLEIAAVLHNIRIDGTINKPAASWCHPNVHVRGVDVEINSVKSNSNSLIISNYKFVMSFITIQMANVLHLAVKKLFCIIIKLLVKRFQIRYSM